VTDAGVGLIGWFGCFWDRAENPPQACRRFELRVLPKPAGRLLITGLQISMLWPASHRT